MNRAEAENKRIVLVTCPSVAVARKIARGVVQRRLAACVNVILSPVESVYRWKGKVERAREYLLVLKTRAKCLAELEREVARLHSYDVPEFVALPITEGSKKYLSWMDDSVSEARKKRK
jgi:periplasmic divalent cation tolerance protein